jgi:hypothetical protein
MKIAHRLLNWGPFRFLSFLSIAILLASSVAIGALDPVTSGVMKDGMPARKMVVELRGANDLYLLATHGGDSYDYDQAVWAEPMLLDAEGKAVDLTTIEPVEAKVGWGELLVNRDHRGEQLSIAGSRFARGFWAHAPSLLHFKLDGKYERLTVWVGLGSGAIRGTVDFQAHSERPTMPSREEYTKALPQTATSQAVPLLAPAPEAPTTFNPEAALRLLAHGIEQIVFVRRYTLSADHVYTEYVNSRWMPGGGLCVLDLRSGEIREVAPEFTQNGVVNRFDISFDARRIVFDFKPSPHEGYRLFEVDIDGSNLRQLTFAPENELELVARYRLGYHHGTDDMHPCYLPDGGVAFVSTRCQYGVLCDSSDNFTVSILHRIDGCGANMRPLSNSALSEQSPTMLPDGRILYHRWEYVDKTAGNIKSLWAMNPDGSGAVEVYGNSIAFPETMIYGRAIPGAPGQIVFLGASHCCPNNAMGTVITLDTSDSARSPDSMRFVTPDIHALHHNGFHFLGHDGQWIHDMSGALGRLFKDPFPVSEELFIVSHKPKGLGWADPAGYALCLLDAEGNTIPLFRDENVSLWHPFPLFPRPAPPLINTPRDDALAEENLAKCLVADVYLGLEGVPRGTVRHIRVLEQLGRPWAARKSWNDRHGQTHAHSVVGDGSLSVKVQHGVVPVEEDGSAYFVVPAMRNIYFQALDSNYMAVQTERTYVNYMPGEMRSCLGCHQKASAVIPPENRLPLAALRQPSRPQPQPGEASPAKVFDYERQIQPIWNRHCITCHNDEKNDGGLNLLGTPVETFSTSYNQLIALSRSSKQLLGFRSARNEDAAWLGQDAMQYLPPYTFGSPTSPLASLLSRGRVELRDPMLREYVARLRESHRDVNLSDEEFVRLANWIDVNGQYHPSYWGRFHAQYRNHPNYRPAITVEEAQMREVPASIRQHEQR